MPTALGSVFLRVIPRNKIEPIHVEDAAAGSATHLALLPLHPWRVVGEQAKYVDPTCRINLTWQQLCNFAAEEGLSLVGDPLNILARGAAADRKSTRLNSSH